MPTVKALGHLIPKYSLHILLPVNPTSWPRLVDVTEPNPSPIADNPSSTRLFSSRKLLVLANMNESKNQSKKRHHNTHSGVGSTSRRVVGVMADCRMSVQVKDLPPKK